MRARCSCRTRREPPTSSRETGGGSRRREDAEKAGAGRAELAALRRQLERSWRRCATVAVQLLLPDGYPDSVSSDYLQYSLWRGVQGIASQISGVLSTQVSVLAPEPRPSVYNSPAIS